MCFCLFPREICELDLGEHMHIVYLGLAAEENLERLYSFVEISTTACA
jgi:hypothetical protein